MLKINDLTLHYGHSQILYDVSMEAEAGAVTCLMGTNGVGKTSLLKAISGTHARSGGEMMLDGQAVPRNAPAHALARMGVGYVPQGRDVFPLMTVRGKSGDRICLSQTGLSVWCRTRFTSCSRCWPR